MACIPNVEFKNGQLYYTDPFGNCVPIQLRAQSKGGGGVSRSTVISLIEEFAPEGLSEFSEFYGLTTGTGNAGPNDYAATVAVKTVPGSGRVPFPRDSETTGSIVRIDASSFTIPDAGIYEVNYKVHTTEPGQLQIELNGVDIADTIAVNMNPTAGGHPIIGSFLITTTLPNTVLAIVNPTGNSAALTVTPADGAQTHANAQNLSIKKLS